MSLMSDAATEPREVLLSLVRAYRAQDVRDERTWRAILEFIDREPLAACRETVEGHLTASAWIVNTTGDRVLLMHHRKLNKWIQPGGHADGDWDLAYVAFREASEETGLSSLEIRTEKVFDVDVHTIPAYKNIAAHRHFDIRFVCVADDEEPLVQNSESYGIAWVAIEAIERYTTEESILRMKGKWLQANLSGHVAR